MSQPRQGIAYPEIVDLISQSPDGTVRLIVVQTAPLSGNNVLALHRKLEHYLRWARGGHMARERPDLAGAPVRIRIDLYERLDALVLTFLRQFRTLALKDGVELELSVDRQLVPL